MTLSDNHVKRVKRKEKKTLLYYWVLAWSSCDFPEAPMSGAWHSSFWNPGACLAEPVTAWGLLTWLLGSLPWGPGYRDKTRAFSKTRNMLGRGWIRFWEQDFLPYGAVVISSKATRSLVRNVFEKHWVAHVQHCLIRLLLSVSHCMMLLLTS